MMQKKYLIGILGIGILLLVVWQGRVWLLHRAESGAIGAAPSGDPFAKIEIPERYDAATRAVIEQKIAATKAMYEGQPDIWETWIAIGNLRSVLDDYEGAIVAYRESVARQPNNILGYRNIAEIYNQHLRDYEKAAEYYELALENKFDEIDVYIVLAQVYDKRLGKSEAAEQTYIRGLQRTGFSNEILAALIQFYKEKGNTEKYIENIKVLLEKNPGNESYKKTYGPILAAHG